MRIAFFNAALSREGPGLLARDLGHGEGQTQAVVDLLAPLQADILVLADVDFDHDLVALTRLARNLRQAGADYPHLFARMPNRGRPTGLDLDGDDRLGEAEDAQGFADFPGQGGLAILSRRPILSDVVQDHSGFLWADLPGALWPEGMQDAARGVLRLSSTAHWVVPVDLGSGRSLHLMIWHASTPAFDGPEDRNGRRNHDETAFWRHLLDGALPIAAPSGPFVLIGQANADPDKGDGMPDGIRALLSDPRLRDPLPGDTVDYGGTIGRLRVSYILPSADLQVLDAGHAQHIPAASRHWPIWVDLGL